MNFQTIIGYIQLHQTGTLLLIASILFLLGVVWRNKKTEDTRVKKHNAFDKEEDEDDEEEDNEESDAENAECTLCIELQGEDEARTAECDTLKEAKDLLAKITSQSDGWVEISEDEYFNRAHIKRTFIEAEE